MSRMLPKNMPEDLKREIEGKGGVEAIIKSIPDRKKLSSKSKIYKALGDPLRLKILCLLRLQESCVCLIRSVVNISYSKLSYHLSIMKSSGLIEGDRRGNYVIYRLTDLGSKFADEICGEG